DTAAANGAAEHPVNAAVAVIGPAVAVLAKGAPELAQRDDHRVSPHRAHFGGEGGEPAAELVEPAGEITLCPALADMRIPATDIEKPYVELVPHQFGDTLCLELETLGRNRAPARGLHLRGHGVDHLPPHAETLVDLRRERGAPTHRRDDRALSAVSRELFARIGNWWQGDPTVRRRRRAGDRISGERGGRQKLPRRQTPDRVAPECLVQAQRSLRGHPGDGLQGSLRQRSGELRVELLKDGLDVDAHGSFLNVGRPDTRDQLSLV